MLARDMISLAGCREDRAEMVNDNRKLDIGLYLFLPWLDSTTDGGVARFQIGRGCSHLDSEMVKIFICWVALIEDQTCSVRSVAAAGDKVCVVVYPCCWLDR